MKRDIEKMFAEYSALSSTLEEYLAGSLELLVLAVGECLSQGNKILLAGNGGSAAEATHIAAEFTGRFKLERQGWSAISLATDQSAITAIANDYGFENIFARQVEALGSTGDILIVLSTSGNSANLIKAVEQARQQGITTVSLTGVDGGALKGKCDLELRVPSRNTPRIQEVHLLVLHTLCELVEIRLTEKNTGVIHRDSE